MYAKVEGNTILTNKTSLLETMDNFRKTASHRLVCNLPETYNLTCTKNMELEFKKIRTKITFVDGTWICKPGEYANRGKGIILFPNLRQAQVFLQKKDQFD